MDGDVRLVPWADDDFRLLRGTSSLEMTGHLGGPESEDEPAARHRGYLELEPAAGRMYRVVLADGGGTAGPVGFWERAWRGGTVWGTGWAVLPGFRGRGLAVRAARAVVEEARAAGRHRRLHAWPKVTHTASNKVCERAGFTLLGPVGFEYPKGHRITCHDWWYDLGGEEG
ncbi:GNAT family N-acetyltransferase [Streptomyces glaucescens]|nr:GNAT family N-acetyltransferase [Streptomyces glaucescens]